MSRKPSRVMTPAARLRAQRRELRKEMARVSELAAQCLRDAIAEGLLEGRVEEDGTIVIEGPPTATRRSPCR
jgi:hypothetical protein